MLVRQVDMVSWSSAHGVRAFLICSMKIEESKFERVSTETRLTTIE